MAEAARDSNRGREAAGGFDRLPVRIEHGASRRAAAVGVLLLPPVVAVMLAPALVLFCSPAQALSSALDNPFAATHAAVGIALWTGLFVVPARRLLQRLGVRVAVHIDGGVVMVCEQALARSSSWQAPLSEFAGIAHRVRSSLSGVRHELYLVHGERGKSLLIHSADRISAATIDDAGALLGLPTIPAAQLYRFGAPLPTMPTALAPSRGA
jgi:hypothetical protein